MNSPERHHRTKHVMKKIFLAIPAIAMLFAIGLSFGTPLHAQTKEPGVTVMSYNIYRGGTMNKGRSITNPSGQKCLVIS